MSNIIKHIGALLAIISMLAAWPSEAAQAAAPLLSRGAWTLHSVSSQELVGEDGAAVKAFDGDAGTN